MSITSFRVPEGDDLVAALQKADAKSDAWVEGVGVVEGVELRLPDGDALRLAGRFSLVSLSGPASGTIMAVLAGAEDAGVVGGELVRATSFGVVVRLTHVEQPNPDLPPPMPKRREPSASASASASSGGGWAAVATRTAAATEDADDSEVEESTELPRYKDRVDHFKFGLCDVMTVRGNRMKIRDAKGPGRIREISLDMLKVLPPEEIAGKRVFKLVKRG